MNPVKLAITFSLFLSLFLLADDTKTLTIFSTSDIHSSLSNDGNRGSWLKVGSLLKKHRPKELMDQSLLIDCGDTIQGTIYGYYSRGEAEMTLLKAMQYDAWVPGNHELDWGIERLKYLTKKCEVPILNGNFSINGEKAFPAYRIYKKAGLKVALIGMNTSWLNHWYIGKRFDGFKVVSARKILLKILPEVQSHKPDFIILAAHQGYVERGKSRENEIKEIAREFPQINLILGGHTHRNFPGARLYSSWYVQPSAYGAVMSKVVVTFNKKTNKLINMESSLLGSASMKEDPDLKKLIQPVLDKVKVESRKVVTQVPKYVSAKNVPGLKCRISYALQEAAVLRTKADAALLARVSNYYWNKGKLTVQDIFRTIPYENYLYTIKLTQAELKSVIEEQLKYYKHRSFNGIYGIKTVIDIKNKRVLALDFPKDKKEITLVLSSYTAASGGGRFPILNELVKRKGFKDSGFSSRNTLIWYLQKNLDWYESFKPYFQVKEKAAQKQP